MDILERRKEFRKKEIEYNVAKLELSLLEMDETKFKIQESIDKLNGELEELDEPKMEVKE